MANITPTQIYRHSIGSAERIIAVFSTATNADVWNSSIPNIINIIGTGVGAFGNPTDGGGSAECGVTWTNAGVITMYPTVSGANVRLLIDTGFANR